MSTRFSRYGLAALSLFLCFGLAACGGGGNSGIGGGDSDKPAARPDTPTPALSCAP